MLRSAALRIGPLHCSGGAEGLQGKKRERKGTSGINDLRAITSSRFTRLPTFARLTMCERAAINVWKMCRQGVIADLLERPHCLNNNLTAPGTARARLRRPTRTRRAGGYAVLHRPPCVPRAL